MTEDGGWRRSSPVMLSFQEEDELVVLNATSCRIVNRKYISRGKLRKYNIPAARKNAVWGGIF